MDGAVTAPEMSVPEVIVSEVIVTALVDVPAPMDGEVAQGLHRLLHLAAARERGVPYRHMPSRRDLCRKTTR